jgi:hypothetical protein
MMLIRCDTRERRMGKNYQGRTPAMALAGKGGFLTEEQAACGDRWAYEYRTRTQDDASVGAGIAAYAERAMTADCSKSPGDPVVAAHRAMLAREAARRADAIARERAAMAFAAVAARPDSGVHRDRWTPEIGRKRAELALAYVRDLTPPAEKLADTQGCRPEAMRLYLAKAIRIVAKIYGVHDDIERRKEYRK